MANEKRLIDACALNRNIDCCDFESSQDYYTICEQVVQAPTVDAVEVVHGEWISDEGDILFHCSECETQISTSWDYDDLHWNYCPNCGAKMDNGG